MSLLYVIFENYYRKPPHYFFFLILEPNSFALHAS